MGIVQLDLEEDLVGLLRASNRPLPQAALELIVLELYRERVISGGRAAELLDMPRWGFIQRASELGIPYFSMTQEEWETEAGESEAL